MVYSLVCDNGSVETLSATAFSKYEFLAFPDWVVSAFGHASAGSPSVACYLNGNLVGVCLAAAGGADGMYWKFAPRGV